MFYHGFVSQFRDWKGYPIGEVPWLMGVNIEALRCYERIKTPGGLIASPPTQRVVKGHYGSDTPSLGEDRTEHVVPRDLGDRLARPRPCARKNEALTAVIAHRP